MAKIFIDPGHGGTEIGAVAHGIIEKNINLTVSLELKRILLLNGQQVKMSRESDMTLGLTERANMANQYGADFFISVHHNAYNGKTAGTEFYTSIFGGKGTDMAQSLSQVFNHYGRQTAIRQRRGIADPSKDYYTVIAKTAMPAIITEAGYIDSGDYINFDTTEDLLTEGKRLAEGILKYLGINCIVYDDIQKQEHFAQAAFDYLKSHGITIHETRFDDQLTRGEKFVLDAQILARIVALENK